MPHQIVEYSANLEEKVDMDALVAHLHETVAGIDAFPRAALRTRAAPRERYRIADDHPDNAFIHVLLRIAAGRTIDVKKAAGEAIFTALCEFLAPVHSASPLGISFEMQEIDPKLRWKRNNLPYYLAKREEPAPTDIGYGG